MVMQLWRLNPLTQQTSGGPELNLRRSLKKGQVRSLRKHIGGTLRTSLGAKPRTWPSKPRTLGFTLIELLIVVAVLGILMGAAVLSLNPASDQRALQGFAQRMAQRIELARDRAIQNNQE